MVTTLWNICWSIHSLSCGCGFEHDDDQDNICMVLCVLMEEHLCCDEDLLFSLFRFSGVSLQCYYFEVSGTECDFFYFFPLGRRAPFSRQYCYSCGLCRMLSFPHIAGSSQCMQNVTSSGFNSVIVEAGVRTCFSCLFDGAVDPNTQWKIRDRNFVLNPINPSDGQVDSGVLTIFDPITVVPLTGLQNQRTLQCDRSGTQVQFYQIFVRRRGMHNYVTRNL